MKKLFQIRVEGPRRSIESLGHFFSMRVFTSLERAQAFAPEFERRCCGEGFLDLERVTKRTFVELELDDVDSEHDRVA